MATNTRITLENNDLKNAMKKIIVAAQKQNSIHNTLLDAITKAQNVLILLSQLKTMTNYLQVILTDYKITLNSIHSHYVPVIFSRTQITEIFTTAEKLYPQYFIPIDPALHGLETLHEYLDVTQTTKPYVYALMVPLVEKHSYNLIETAAMPVRNQEGSLFKIKNLQKFIGISKLHFFTSNTKLEPCRTLKKITICKAPLKLQDITLKNDCTRNIVRNNTNSCIFAPLRLSNNIYTTKMQNAWFVFINKATTAVLQYGKERVARKF